MTSEALTTVTLQDDERHLKMPAGAEVILDLPDGTSLQLLASHGGGIRITACDAHAMVTVEPYDDDSILIKTRREPRP